MDNQNNLILNPHFALWPYGASKTSSASPDLAACWLWNLGTLNTASLSLQTAGSSTKYVKWIRSQPCLELDITGITNPSQFRVYQKINCQRFDLSRTLIRCTIIASGPAGESFYYGIGDQKQKLTMLGQSGSPAIERLVSTTSTFPVGDLANQNLEITAFEEPSSTGKFYVYMMFAAVNKGNNGDRINHRSDRDEWKEMSPYITPIVKGTLGIGASTTQVRIPVAAGAGGWISNPSIPASGQVGTIDLVDLQTAAVSTHVGVTYTLGVAPSPNVNGCNVVLGNLTGLTAGRQYIVGDTSTQICVLNHGY